MEDQLNSLMDEWSVGSVKATVPAGRWIPQRPHLALS